MNLLPQQTEARDHLSNWRVGALFMEPGTGKTRVAVELVRRANPGAVLWVGPYRTINPGGNLLSVVSEIEKWGGFRCQVGYVGIESLQASDRIFLEIRNFCEKNDNLFIIVDESLKIKNADAKRTKRLLDLGKFAKYKLILNGTPITRNLLDLWAQMEFLSPKILNMSLAQFKNTFCEYTTITKRYGGYKSYVKEFITGYENVDYLYSLVRHYVFECDLSLQIKQLYSELSYTLDDESRDEYYRLKTEYLDDEKLMWKNNNIFMELTQKMQHTYCCTESKFEAVENLFKEIDPSRTIIFCKYVKSQEECRRWFPKSAVLSYQKDSFGLNLQQYRNTIYFDKNWDYALRVQSGRRTFRTGQEQDCRYWDLTGDVGLERLIDKNIAHKVCLIEYFKSKTKEEIKADL